MGLWTGTHPVREAEYPCPSHHLLVDTRITTSDLQAQAPPAPGTILCDIKAHTCATDCTHHRTTVLCVPGRFRVMGRWSSGERWGFWGLAPKQAGGAQTVSPGSVPVTSWPLVLCRYLWLQPSPWCKDTVARNQGCRLTCVTLPGMLSAALSTHHPPAGDLWVMVPASPRLPSPATVSLGHDIPIHIVETQIRGDTWLRA